MGSLYDEFKDKLLDTAKMEQEIPTLMMDDDVTSQKGIYPYVLTRKRSFEHPSFYENQKRTATNDKRVLQQVRRPLRIKRNGGRPYNALEQGRKNKPGNCQMLCLECNRRKCDIYDV